MSAIKKAEQSKVNNFKAVTAAQGLNMTDVLMAYIQSYVDKYAAKPKGRRG